MLTHERYQIILNLLNEKHSVTVSELTSILKTSESTVRRDLNDLNNEGKLIKVFGGATSIKQTSGVNEYAVSSRETIMVDEKIEIAKYCANMINDSDFVYIDSGTTTAQMIPFITQKKVTYVTNGISHAKELIKRGFKTYIIGGKIKPLTEAIVGIEGIRSINNFNFTKAFMGTNGIDIDAGFTTPDIEEGLLKQAIVEKSYMTFVLADNTKFNCVYPVSFSKINKCCIITNKLTDKRFSNLTVIKEVIQ